MGALYRNTLDLDFALDKGFVVDLDGLNYLEFLLLRILTDESRKYEAEEIKRAQDSGNQSHQHRSRP